jgi:hypothetical protein
MHDDSGSAETQALLRVIRNGYRPFQAVTLRAPAGHQSPIRLGFVPSWTERKQDLERQTICEEEAASLIAYTTCRDAPVKVSVPVLEL